MKDACPPEEGCLAECGGGEERSEEGEGEEHQEEARAAMPERGPGTPGRQEYEQPTHDVQGVAPLKGVHHTGEEEEKAKETKCLS